MTTNRIVPPTLPTTMAANSQDDRPLLGNFSDFTVVVEGVVLGDVGEALLVLVVGDCMRNLMAGVLDIPPELFTLSTALTAKKMDVL